MIEELLPFAQPGFDGVAVVCVLMGIERGVRDLEPFTRAASCPRSPGRPVLVSPSLTASLLAFIADHVDTIDHLEILLLLAAHAREEWTAAKVAAELRLNVEATAGRLAALHDSGFVTRHEGSAVAYRYAPRDDALATNVVQLRHAYATRRVAVVSAIFSPTTRASRAFAADLVKPGGG